MGVVHHYRYRKAVQLPLSLSRRVWPALDRWRAAHLERPDATTQFKVDRKVYRLFSDNGRHVIKFIKPTITKHATDSSGNFCTRAWRLCRPGVGAADAAPRGGFPLQRVSTLHPSYLPLHYVLLFHGPHKRTQLTMRHFHAYRLFTRREVVEVGHNQQRLLICRCRVARHSDLPGDQN
ncbi:hypothetical protein V8E54_005134 [Elaphomyces granulatus]